MRAFVFGGQRRLRPWRPSIRKAFAEGQCLIAEVPSSGFARNALARAYQHRLIELFLSRRSRRVLLNAANRTNKTGQTRETRAEGARSAFLFWWDVLSHVNFANHRIEKFSARGQPSGYCMRLLALNADLSPSRAKRAQRRAAATCMIGSRRNHRNTDAGYRGTASTRWLTPACLALFGMQKQTADYHSQRANKPAPKRSPEEIAEDLQNAARSRAVIRAATKRPRHRSDDEIEAASRADMAAIMRALADDPGLTGQALRDAANRYK